MSDLVFSAVLALSVMPLGFLFGACSACCQRPCRVFNDPLTIIGDWWEVCSGSWSITGGGGTLTSGSAGVLTFLVTDPDTPYGIFTAEIEAIEDVIYYLYVKRGADETEPCAAPDITIAYEYKGSDWEVSVTGATPFTVFSPSSTVRVGACVDSGGVTVIFDDARVFQKCQSISGFFFGIGASAAGTEWEAFEYSDHYQSNTNCPLCESSKCFSDFGTTISGFDIEINGITNGANCGCPSTIEAFVPFDESTLGICGFSNSGSTTVSEFTGGANECQSATITVSLSCSAGGPIVLSVNLDHPGLEGNEWSESFSSGEAPGNIRVVDLPIDDEDQGFACDYSSATLTATPRTVIGCCGGNPLP